MKTAWNIDESRILTRGELTTVMADLDRRAKRSVNSRQNQAVFVLATFCGLRVSEICGLLMEDMRLAVQRPTITVRPQIAKGGRGRTIPLWRLPTALSYLEAWKRSRELNGTSRKDPFLASLSSGAAGKPLDRRNARHRFRVACRVLGAERCERLTIHDGRHTCASHLLAAGWPLPNVRDMLGHASIATTSIYSHVVLDDDRSDPFARLVTTPKESP